MGELFLKDRTCTHNEKQNRLNLLCANVYSSLQQGQEEARCLKHSQTSSGKGKSHGNGQQPRCTLQNEAVSWCCAVFDRPCDRMAAHQQLFREMRSTVFFLSSTFLGCQEVAVSCDLLLQQTSTAAPIQTCWCIIPFDVMLG